MKTISRRNLFIVAGIVVVLLLIWAMFRTPAVSVETAKAARGPMLVTVDGEGKTRFRDKYTVTAPVSGRMVRIGLNEGDNIPKDYVITHIDPNPPTPRPPGEYDDRVNPSAVHVYAPATGKVLRIFDKSERIIAAGTPIIEIGNPSTVEVLVDVLSTDAAQIRPGANVLMHSETRAEAIRGRVRTVEPQAYTKISALGVEEQRVDIVVDFTARDEVLGDNFRIDTRIIVWQADDVLKVPSSALFRDGEKWNVFVLDGGKARRREITAGRQNPMETEITDGLEPGETVILHPPSTLEEGTRVTAE